MSNIIHQQTKRSFKIGRYTISLIYKFSVENLWTYGMKIHSKGWVIQIKDRIEHKHKQKTFKNEVRAVNQFRGLYIDNELNWETIWK